MKHSYRIVVMFVFAASVLILASWVSARDSVNTEEIRPQTAGNSLTHRYKNTIVGSNSAILLDSWTGESWYLRNGREGTVWLSIPKIGLDEREAWLKRDQGNTNHRNSDLGS